jgi:molecular chaperone GrpE (heat shock protein)
MTDNHVIADLVHKLEVARATIEAADLMVATLEQTVIAENEELHAEVARLRDALLALRAEVDHLVSPITALRSDDYARGYENAIKAALTIIDAHDKAVGR